MQDTILGVQGTLLSPPLLRQFPTPLDVNPETMESLEGCRSIQQEDTWNPSVAYLGRPTYRCGIGCRYVLCMYVTLGPGPSSSMGKLGVEFTSTDNEREREGKKAKGRLPAPNPPFPYHGLVPILLLHSIRKLAG